MSLFQALKGMSGTVELTRLIGASAAVLYPAPYIRVAFEKGIFPDVSYGTNYALVLAAIGAMIGGKDYAVARATATIQGANDATAKSNSATV